MIENYLPDFKDRDFSDILNDISISENQSLFVFSCGYEERSLSQYLKVKEIAKNSNVHYLCFSFSTYKMSGSRALNEETLSDDGVKSIELDPSDWDGAWLNLKEHFENSQIQNLDIYIDYSSMPRNWYCMLAQKVIEGALGSKVTFVYSHGKYFDTQYPCVGYGEFNHFSGRPNITSTRELTIFGLGFDSIRTHGIWTFLDPQLSVAIIARSPKNSEHCERVVKENPELLGAAESVHEVNIDKFNSTLSTLIDLSRKYSSFGDIALVPDGPKPLVLAMSLVPYYLGERGVYSWHVGHVKPDEYDPVDVKCSGEFFGFGIS